MMNTNPVLASIAKEMVTQDNRSTDYPLFVVQVSEKIPAYVGQDHDGIERIEDSRMCESCKKLTANSEKVPDYCEECPKSSFFKYQYVRTFDLRAGVFFTAKACEAHIKANHYHYKDPCSYAIGSWRNPEMQTVMNFLKGLL